MAIFTKNKHDIREFENQYFRYKENSQKHFWKSLQFKTTFIIEIFL